MSENVMKKELNTNQKRALVALLEHGTVRGAAAAVGLAEKTIYRYLQDETFKTALNSAVVGLISAAGVRLYSGQDNALETLAEIMEHGKRDSDRRLAAANWLTFVYRHLEMAELKDEIEWIKERLNGIEK